ncbi:DDE-type integrase/transposase/recombinase [Bradyrhizobium sp. CB1650]|uniref:Mu transposase C-terminal domain-containing protein n=1 Tax=Bradyrhizobium sp. CB1650 TaxID=3039153 RepID=UPI0024359385|nr:Mu transposase C-terminal domain-containing protein [Bradyrhizobium sp. CB1650]WGD52442.1 DDE-type integrase/transposase/recombinase [Bradyrhizobium sp. CB1650]
MNAPLIRLNKGDAVVIDGVRYEEKLRTKCSLTLCPIGGEVARTFTAEELADLYFDPAGRMKIERATPAALEEELVETVSRPFESFTADQQTEMLKRLDYVKGCDRFFPRGCYSKRPDGGYAKIALIVARYRRLVCARDEGCRPRSLGLDEVSGSTLRDWYGRWIRSGRMLGALAPLTHRRGSKKPKMDGAVRGIIAKYVRQKWLTLERPTLTVVHQMICGEIELVNSQRVGGSLVEPSEMAVRRWIGKNLDRYEIIFYRRGRKEADHEARLTKRAPVATRPLQIVEFDDTPLDIIIVDDNGKPIGRAYLTAGICLTTGMIVGWYIGIENPSWSTVMQALRMAVLKKDEKELEGCGAESPYPVYGLPEMIKMDNGAAYRSQSMVAAAGQLQIELRLVPVGKPHLKGKVERFFGEVARDFFSLMPGRTFANVQERGDYDSEGYARFTLRDVRRMFMRWVVDIYHNRPNSRSFGQTPLERWQALSGAGVRLPPEAMDLAPLIGLVINRTIVAEGITFMGLHYSSPALKDFRKRGHLGQQWMVKIDPLDIGQVLVLDERKHRWTAVPCVHPELVDGLTLRMWMDVVSAARDMTEQGRRVRRSSLLKARENLMRAARKAGNKPRGKITEKDYRWMQERLDDPDFKISVELDESAEEGKPRTPKEAASARRKDRRAAQPTSPDHDRSATEPASKAKGHPVAEREVPGAATKAREQEVADEVEELEEEDKLRAFREDSARKSGGPDLGKTITTPARQQAGKLPEVSAPPLSPGNHPAEEEKQAKVPVTSAQSPTSSGVRSRRRSLVDENDDDLFG